mgnify:CR=1 FL=1
MNLIDRLGGYEAAKLEGEKWGFDEFLLKQLLEYRREHNIFEIGDLVVLPYTNYKVDVFELTDGNREVYDDKGVCYRHATDEEIKAGRRL